MNLLEFLMGITDTKLPLQLTLTLKQVVPMLQIHPIGMELQLVTRKFGYLLTMHLMILTEEHQLKTSFKH